MEAAEQDPINISNEDCKVLNQVVVNNSKLETDSNSSATEDIPITDFNLPENNVSVEKTEIETEDVSSIEPKVPRKRGRKRRIPIYNDTDDPETIKEKKKKRAIELKLRKLRCTFNDSTEVCGKRQKKAPQRFELQPVEKRKSTVDDGNGSGEFLGDIRWISNQLRSASLHTLRLLHRLIYRKQGMFAEKQIIKSVVKFNGYPFDRDHTELIRRQEQLEKLNESDLQSLSMLLGLRPGSHEEMIDRIIEFLLCPSQSAIEEYVQEVMDSKLHQSKQIIQKTLLFETTFQNPVAEDSNEHPLFPEFPISRTKIDLDTPWTAPTFFTEGTGVKLKCITAILTNVEIASDAFIELMHRLLFLNIDEKMNMRRNILEFNGFKCEMGSSNYVYRVRILSVLPMDQLKLICRVLCLPTWHRSRQFLTDSIMDFLAVPRISVMKKRVPSVIPDLSFSLDRAKFNNDKIPELKSSESEEIEIVPDIPDYSSHPCQDIQLENEYNEVMLKNFSNIHYQVISTPAVKLTDVHMILYLTPSAQNNIRKSILEFSGFQFDEMSVEYKCRRRLMEQMSLKSLKTVATVLCVSQYVCDESKQSLIEAILKFLSNPGALLSSSTALPSISVPVVKPAVIKKKATSTCKPAKASTDDKPSIIISSVWSESDAPAKPTGNPDPPPKTDDPVEEIQKVKACFPNASIEITPVPAPKLENAVVPKLSVERVALTIKKEKNGTLSEADETLSCMKKEEIKTTPCVKYFASDEEEDQPLSKMIGHPNDDQLRCLIANIMKKSRLSEITMKHVIQQVFDTYPNYDLNYRREFIKSNVRLILSQMGDQNCSVSTTVVSV